MRKSMNEIMVRTIVKKAIRNLKTDPERTIRNLVDMAAQFAGSRFQQEFYSGAQGLLSNERSGYYPLVKDTISKVNEETLLKFCMNLGYNGLYLGTRTIRETQQQEGYHIPWSICLTVTEDSLCDRHEQLIQDGEQLGIRCWHLFSNHGLYDCMTLAQCHPESAFVIFFDRQEIGLSVLDYADDIHNAAIFVPYDDYADISCELLQASGMLYGVYHCYTQKDLPAIQSGELFGDIQQLHPTLTVLMPRFHCQQELRQQVYDWITRARIQQTYHTIPLEFYSDSLLVDSIVGGEPAWVGFDSYGQLNTENGIRLEQELNLFRNDLPTILKQAFPLM